MYILDRIVGLKHRTLLADTVAAIATANGDAMPIDFFDVQAKVRVYVETQEFCDELERRHPNRELIQKCQEASALVLVVFFNRVLIYDEFDEAEAQKLMDELQEARRHLFQAFLILEKLGAPV